MPRIEHTRSKLLFCGCVWKAAVPEIKQLIGVLLEIVELPEVYVRIEPIRDSSELGVEHVTAEPEEGRVLAFVVGATDAGSTRRGVS